jgi:hypothetical protein
MPFISRPAAGQIIDPAWGTLVADAVVMRFTTAAQRSSQLTAPVTGQLTTTDDRPGALQRWTGSAWVDLAVQVQSGLQTVTTDAAGLATITFPVAFASGVSPAVTCNLAGPSSTSTPITAMIISNPLATAFAAKIWAGNAAYLNLPITVVWIAVGARA